MTRLPGAISLVSRRLIAALDLAMPSQLEAFYIVGSVALGDYCDGHSDLDFVAVLSGQVDIAALAQLHAELATRFPSLDCDGIYLHPGDLARPPGGVGPAARGGRVDPASADERHPVAWQLLADSGVALRGPAPTATLVAADRAATMAYSRQNLDTYWRHWLTRFEQHHAELDTAGVDTAVHWGVLGALRVHRTMTTGRVPSKTAGGIYGQSTFPRHDAIIDEALRLRRAPSSPSSYGEPAARAEAVIDLLRKLIGP
ncbi:DNA polymerase subunit beta [Devosia aquimaris]|uniref:DNA polymerase subunit beta n=1 Tax=Devosia aquimaris TaxID=2866214 RepID=UPI001CD0CF00|nr:DNA polymerase subunit beta [Devosia sp. CJK-A8-3]